LPASAQTCIFFRGCANIFSMKRVICIFIIVMHLAGCATYKSQSVSFRPPKDYPNHLTVEGAELGAEAYVDPSKAEQAFGFDVCGAGLLPVQIVLDNQSGQGIEVLSEQTFLIDASDNYWKVLTTRQAVERVDKATKAGHIGKGAGSGAMYGTAAGAILGLAIGILTGRVGQAAFKGAVLGASGGAVIGGSMAADDYSHESKISGDVHDKKVEGKTFPAGTLTNGFLFFPGEAASAKELRLQIRFRATGAVRTLLIPFNPSIKPSVIPSAPVTRP